MSGEPSVGQAQDLVIIIEQAMNRINERLNQMELSWDQRIRDTERRDQETAQQVAREAAAQIAQQAGQAAVDQAAELAERTARQAAERAAASAEAAQRAAATAATAQTAATQQADRPSSVDNDFRTVNDDVIARLLENNGSRPKITHPEAFSGQETDNINEFVNKCSRVFMFDHSRYATAETKIAFAVNLLKGKAYQWYECYEDLAPEDRPLFCHDWELFKAELKRKFTAVDPREDARLKLVKLKQTGDVASYQLEFDRLVVRLPEYGDLVRRDMFFQGLNQRVKLELLSPDNYPTYRTLVDRAVRYDRQYNQHNKTSYASVTAQGNGNGSSGSSPMEIDGTASASKGGKKLKLSPEERQRRLENGLCFGCGKSGHISKDCPSKPKKATSIAATSTVEDNTTAGTQEPTSEN